MKRRTGERGVFNWLLSFKIGNCPFREWPRLAYFCKLAVLI